MELIGFSLLFILFWGLASMWWSYIAVIGVSWAGLMFVAMFLFGMDKINYWAPVIGVIELVIMFLFWGRFRYTRIAISLGVMIFSLTFAPMVFLGQAVTEGFSTPRMLDIKDRWERQWVMPDVNFFSLFTNDAYREYIAAAHPMEMLFFVELCVVLFWVFTLAPAAIAARDFRGGNTMMGTCYGYFDNDDAYPDDAQPVRHTFPFFN